MWPQRGHADPVVSPLPSPAAASAEGSRPLKFVHITKTGGSSIEDTGRALNFTWGRFHKDVASWHACFSAYKKRLKERFDWFTVVRNPFERLVSEFHCKWGGVGDRARNFDLDGFNTHIIRQVQRVQAGRPFRGQSGCTHYTRQYWYLDWEKPLVVLHAERLEAEMTEMLAVYMRGLAFPGLQRANVAAAKSFTIFDLNDTAVDLIRAVYEQDFTVFGYSRGE